MRVHQWFGALNAGLLVVLLLAGCQGGSFSAFTHSDEQTSASGIAVLENDIRATITDNGLTVQLPIRLQWDLGLQLRLHLALSTLDDIAVTQAEGIVQFTGKSTKAVLMQLPLDAPLAKHDLASYLITYAVTGNDVIRLHGRRSLYAAVQFNAIQLVAPGTFHSGTESYIRVLVSEGPTGRALADAPVSIFVADGDGNRRPLASGRTNEKGELAVPITIPEDLLGHYQLQVDVPSPTMTETISQPIQIKREEKLLLTTDKPIYQPGQVIHLRALSLKKPSLQPEAQKELVFEVLDPKGNKVFKKTRTTNNFGVAWARFQLATLINMGTYKVRATLGNTTSEKDLKVDRYALPKFKVDTTLNSTYYFPGDPLSGTVSARYFFGKQVQQGQVRVVAQAYDIGFTTFQEIVGETSDEGLFDFSLQLPDYFAGMPLTQGNGMGQLVVSVTDGAQHEETKYVPFTITGSAVQGSAIPDGGRVILGQKNRIYVVTTDPVGSPARASFTVQLCPQYGCQGYYQPFAETAGHTGANGMSEVQLFVPAHPEDLYGYYGYGYALELTVADDDGRQLVTTTPVDTQEAVHHIAVLTDKAIYQVGDTMLVEVMAADRQDHVYVDVIRGRQTTLTRILELHEGSASLEIDVDDGLSGELQVEAYYLNSEADVVRGHRTVYVQHADRLTVDVSMNQQIYRPAEEARLTFTVSDIEGSPVQTALGVYIVDEAVFALTEAKPGLLETFFQLEEDLQHPRYQIKGPGGDFTSLAMSEPEEDPASEEQRQQQAQIALSAIATDPVNQISENSYKRSLSQMKTTLERVLQQDIDKIVADIKASPRAESITHQNVDEFLLDLSGEWVDIFGKPYYFARRGASSGYEAIHLCSHGPDELPDTVDDLQWPFPTYDIIHRDPSPWGGSNSGMAQDASVAADTSMPRSDASQSPPGEEPSGEQPRVRKYFPETLYVAPSIITDECGQAEVTVPLADSITSWRISALGSSAQGQLGSMARGLTVFQDFFVDIDFPAVLTQNDIISVPIAIYNYLAESQAVTLEVVQQPWFELQGTDSQTLQIGPNAVSVAYFPIQVKQIGTHALTVYGYGDQLSDAIARTVLVQPDGKEVRTTESGYLSESVVKTVTIPPNAIADSENLMVKIYPGYLSQAVEGLDSLLRLPFG